MNPWTNRMLNLIVCSALSACTIGNGMICGPQTPIAYCDREAYEKLIHPKPYVEFWDKVGASADQRSLDWVACGGASNGDFSPAIGRVKEEMRPEEHDFNAAHKRLQERLKHCMREKGYEYMGVKSNATVPQRSTD